MESVTGVPSRGQDLAYHVGLALVVVEYGDSHGR
jgi:hypothetical protein